MSINSGHNQLQLYTLVIIYTVSGGTKAVTVTQKQQMFVIFAGMVAALVIIVNLIPDEVSFVDAIDVIFLLKLFPNLLYIALKMIALLLSTF